MSILFMSREANGRDHSIRTSARLGRDRSCQYLLALFGVASVFACALILIAAVVLTSSQGTRVASVIKPSVVIQSPANASQFREGDQIAVQSVASDTSGVTRIELFVDGAMAGTSVAPAAQGSPLFAVTQTWPATVGTHTVGVRAFNAAGIVSDMATIAITVAAATPPPPAALPSAPITPATATATSVPTPTPRPTPKSIPTGPLPIPSLFTFEFDEGVTPEEREEIQEAAVLAHEYLGGNRPVFVYAYADLDALIADVSRHLQRSKDSPMSQTDKEGFSSGEALAMSASDMIQIWVSGGWKSESREDRLQTIAHEYFHVMQSNLSGKPNSEDKGPFWLLDGSAMFAEMRLAAAYGLVDLETYRNETAARTRGILNPLVALESWSGANLEDTYAIYSLGYLAVELLASNSGEQAVFQKYWEVRSTAPTWQDAFQTAFGVSVDQFYADFEEYRRTQFPPYCGMVRTTSEDPGSVPFSIQFHQQHAPGTLTFSSERSTSAPNVPYTFCVKGFPLVSLTDLSKAYKLPIGYSAWDSCGGNCIILYMKPDAPAGNYVFAIELPDGRQADTTFQHSIPTAAFTPVAIVPPRLVPRPMPVATSTPRTVPSLLMSLSSTKIAFKSDRDGNEEIYVMRADGSQQTRLTNNEAMDRLPAWSPDGTRIAFDSKRDGNCEIYVMNADGSQQTRLTKNSAWDTGPAWSPDGRRIAFASYRDGNYEIYVMSADGSQPTRLTKNSASDTDPAWSPDGQRLAFSSNRDGNDEIYVMKADGSQLSRLTNNTTEDYLPTWSPDGRRIAFESGRDGKNEIYVMNADGSEQTRLTNNWVTNFHPTWSPDGMWIAFNCDGVSSFEICVMNADGSQQTHWTDAPGNNSGSDWGPRMDQAITLPAAPAVAVQPTPVPPTRVRATPSPSLPPGIYVDAVALDPPEPKDGQFPAFNVTFINTLGQTVYYKWFVKIYDPDAKQSMGETAKVDSTLPAGTSVQTSAANWKAIGTTPCRQFIARVFYQAPDKTILEFPKPGGDALWRYFSVCQ